MIDEQRLAELPTYSRMAWSSRPVWDRRPPMGQRCRSSHGYGCGSSSSLLTLVDPVILGTMLTRWRDRIPGRLTVPSPGRKSL